jgi:lipoprotein-anchoring transpeptidase ErfK/SrfK
VLADENGTTSAIDRLLISSPAQTVLHPVLSPDQMTVGVGQPIVLQIDHAVTGAAARAALLQHLTVTTSPPVVGAWRFLDSYEVHYRPQHYWKRGTEVTVAVNLSGFRLPGTRTWGSQTAHSAMFTVGDALMSTVDVTAHTMTVRRNGRLLRTLEVSTGREKYPTKGGIHIILSVEREQLFDSSTVGIPTASPDGYYEKLPFSMRISNGGAFVHANPATVRDQGRRNVSHGCVNLSLADAQWFYDISHRGDVVSIVNAVVPPVLTDAGMADWNYDWPTWQLGNLN